jgi:hypothetical protein
MSTVVEECGPLIVEAREKGLWLHCAYQDLWFNPDELKKAQSEGRFRWGLVNWELRDPRHRVSALRREITKLEAEIRAFQARMSGPKEF